MTQHGFMRWVIAGCGLLALVAVLLVTLVVATSTRGVSSIESAVGPNTQVQLAMNGDQDRPANATDLTYGDTSQPAADPLCSPSGRWYLDVNPRDMVGYPYAHPPRLRDWARAASAVAIARTICQVTIVIKWVGHDSARPASDSWFALLPASAAANLGGAALRRYALKHAAQL